MRNLFRRVRNSLRELVLTYLLIGLFFAVGALIFARGTIIVPLFGAAYALLLAGVYAIAPRPLVRYLATLMAGAALFCAAGLQSSPANSALQAGQTFAGGALYVCLFLAVTQRLLRQRKVTLETISGAMILYLLLGLVFGKVFGLVEALAPGSFASHGAGQAAAIAPPYGELVYFSFITLTTCGLGDVTPVTPLARTLTVWELIAGFFYTVGFLSRVVSVHLAHVVTKTASEKKSDE